MALNLRNGETTILSCLGSTARKLTVSNGGFYLTNQRLIFAKHAVWEWILWIGLLGIIGLIIISETKGKKPKYEISLDKIVRVESVRWRFNNSAVLYTEKESYKVIFRNKRMLSLIKEAIITHTRKDVVEFENGFTVK